MHVITFKQTFKIPFLRRKFQFAIHNPITINYFPSFLCFFLSSFSLPLSLKPSPITLFSRLDTRQHHSHFISQITFLCYSLITSIGFKYQNRSLSSQSPPDRFEEWKPNIPSVLSSPLLQALRVTKETKSPILLSRLRDGEGRRSKWEISNSWKGKRAPINDISGRSFADELRSKRLRKLNYR